MVPYRTPDPGHDRVRPDRPGRRHPLQHDLERLKHQALAFASESKSDATRRAYRSDWNIFETWCRKVGTDSLPASPEMVALFVTWLVDKGLKLSTVDRKLVAISQAHKMNGYRSPTSHAMVREVLKGIRRSLGASLNQKHPILTEHLKAMLETLPDTLIGLRNRALLLVGFSGGLRRSEIIGINVEHLTFTNEGVIILIARSKTDQQGEGKEIGIPHAQNIEMCPVEALSAWLAKTGINDGPVFRPINKYGAVLPRRLGDRSVARIVKQCIQAAGYHPKDYSGHSLRSGFATSAATSGKTERDIMAQTRHRYVRTLRRYIRRGELFENNPATGLL